VWTYRNRPKRIGTMSPKTDLYVSPLPVLLLEWVSMYCTRIVQAEECSGCRLRWIIPPYSELSITIRSPLDSSHVHTHTTRVCTPRNKSPATYETGSRRYLISWEVGLERGPLSLVSTIEELLERKSSGSGLESREYGRRNPSRWLRDIPLSAKVGNNFVGMRRVAASV
jgi:hypothetical protein